MGVAANLFGLMVMETARALAGNTAMSCEFPPTDADPSPTIEVSIAPTPSLRDLPHLRRVTLELNNRHRLTGTVESARASGLDAVVLRGASDKEFRYLIGVHRSGQAVLTIQAPAEVPPASRPGFCIGQDVQMRLWTFK